MELVERYIAAVKRELPDVKQAEIGRELHANIMDQLDALKGDKGSLTEADISTMLKQMGHPRRVAQQFVPQLPLVSSGYMPLYKNTLFMVLGILFLLQVLASTTAWLSHANIGLLGYLLGIASGFVGEACFAFTTITIIFFLMSKQSPEDQCPGEENWHPEELPNVKATWQSIKRQDVFTDLATYIFVLIVTWQPLWSTSQEIAQSSLMLSEEARTLLQYTTPLFVLGMVNSLWQLKQRFWSSQMLKCNIAFNAVFTALVLYCLATISPLLQLNLEHWHPVFGLEHLERSATITLVIIALFPAWEVIRDTLRLRKLA